MDLGATQRIGRLVGTRGEQRVREADPVAVELDDTGLESGRQTDVAVDTPTPPR